MTRSLSVLLLTARPSVAESVEEDLGRAHDLRVVGTLDESLVTVRAERPDVVIVDLTEGDLRRATEIVKTFTSLPPHGLPLVALVDDDDHGEDARRAGAEEFAAPGSGEVLRRAIRHAVERHLLEHQLEEAQATQRRLARLATIDPLTQLSNRREFLGDLERAVTSARRHAHPLSVSMCDVDDFKRVNDEHGHLAGDQVLMQLGALIRHQLRTEDLAGRYGGDEFCLAFPHTPTVAARVALERLRMRLAGARFRSESGRRFGVTASFGLAALTGHDENEQALLHRADRALLAAKRRGRNRLEIANE